MVCPDCGVEVADGQKFCHECGAALAGRPPAEPPAESGDGSPSGSPDPTELAGLLDTEPVDATAPPPPAELPDTEPVEAMAPPRPGELVEIRPVEAIDEPTVPVDMADDRSLAPPATDSIELHEATPATTTAQMPTLFDGSADLVEYAEPREPFRIRIVFVLSLFATAAVLMSIVADVIDIRTTRPAAGIVTGTRTLEDLGTNLGLAAFAASAIMVLGALLACFGHRWGAGLAGGAGLALLGWAGLTIGLAELPIAIAESITRTSPEQFTLRVTRDLGWWLIASVGVLGVLVFFASLRSIGTGARPALNPLVAAVTAVAAVVLGFGPLVPVGDATFSDNFRSGDPSRDLPTAFFAGRLGQVALIAAVGAVGMLLVRAYGLGLAAGAVTTATVLWITSLVELGDRPIGIADRNPGAATTVPHAVTTVGMVGTLALLALATVLAIIRLHRRP